MDKRTTGSRFYEYRSVLFFLIGRSPNHLKVYLDAIISNLKSSAVRIFEIR